MKYEGLIVAHQPFLYNLGYDSYTYERNPKSTAYIPYGEGKYYVMGALNGGISNIYLKMCEELSRNIQIDLKNNIIALWHDESHLNKYIVDKNFLIMECNYLYPEGFILPEYMDNIKILMLEKENAKWGGRKYLRN